MNYLEAVTIALQSLRANRLRSLLTLLGIVIGVMAVIAVVSIISGLNDYVASKIFNLGPDVLTISRMNPVVSSFDDWIENQKRKNLYLADMQAVQSACTNCKALGASVNQRGRVKFGREYVDSQIQGYTSDLAGILGTELSGGRFMTAYDVDHARNVCIIGSDIAETLFPYVDPIGKDLVIDDRTFEIIGIGTKQGSVLGQSRDNWAMIPLTIHQKMYGARRSVQIYAKAIDEKHVSAAESEIRLVLRGRRHLSYNMKDDFALNTNDNFLQIWANISRAFFAVTVGIASISLVVGGIVVMNIMLVSVTERTFEIGLRKAVGARSKQILAQFLIESSALASVGGLFGLFLATGLSWVISATTPIPMTITLPYVMLSLLVSGGIGMIFGIYPAYKASKLDPIIALTKN